MKDDNRKRELSIIEAKLNGMTIDCVKTRLLLLREKYRLQAEINLYPEYKLVEKEVEPIFIEEVELKPVEERGGLYYMLLIFILTSESKNKAFLLIALELFAKDVKYEKIYTTKRLQ